MTKVLEDALGLPSLQEALAEISEDNLEDDSTVNMTDDEVERFSRALENSHELEHSLRDPDGTIEHAKEMDDLFKQAMSVHRDAVDLAFNMEPKNAGSVLGPAAQFMNLAMQASRSKLDSKLKVMKLKMDRQKVDMEQERLDHELRKNVLDGTVAGSEIPTAGKFVADRNDLIRQMRQKPPTP